MERDAEATKRRLVAAGRAEFAAHGLNGARVDRIAAAARSNKAQIYHYFGNKAGLFDAVWNELVEQIVVSVPLDVDDLPGFAAGLGDLYAADPDMPRIITWQRLEHGDAFNELAVAEVRRRSADIARGQADGRVSTRFEPEVLFALLVHVAMLWAAANPEVLTVVDVADRERSRELIRRIATVLAE
ncbi:TetR family transcriptional regulator [Kitasatospora purpeofusca]|uniref:TetR family transcriptional regulator n=1 Tax=Kitasatospora purpeofusca TaxID=67352 RepID=UPI0004BEEF63|nr:TetR family transcriptional regulator [Kitasatospora purpeofusca]